MGLFSGGFILGVKNKLRNAWAYSYFGVCVCVCGGEGVGGGGGGVFSVFYV